MQINTDGKIVTKNSLCCRYVALLGQPIKTLHLSLCVGAVCSTFRGQTVAQNTNSITEKSALTLTYLLNIVGKINQSIQFFSSPFTKHRYSTSSLYILQLLLYLSNHATCINNSGFHSVTFIMNTVKSIADNNNNVNYIRIYFLNSH